MTKKLFAIFLGLGYNVNVKCKYKKMKIKTIENEKEIELEVTVEEIKDIEFFIRTHEKRIVNIIKEAFM